MIKTEQVTRNKILIIEETDGLLDMYRLCGERFDTVFLPLCFKKREAGDGVDKLLDHVMAQVCVDGVIPENTRICWYESNKTPYIERT